MKIIYLDQSIYHQHGMAALIDEPYLFCCQTIVDVTDTLKSSLSQITIIFDLSANLRTAMTQINFFMLLKKERNVTLVLFTDFERNMIQFSEFGLEVDYFLNKKTMSINYSEVYIVSLQLLKLKLNHPTMIH